MKICPTTGKVRRRRKTAVVAAGRAQRKARINIQVYKCPDCGSWHLTKVPKRNWGRYKAKEIA